MNLFVLQTNLSTTVNFWINWKKKSISSVMTEHQPTPKFLRPIKTKIIITPVRIKVNGIKKIQYLIKLSLKVISTGTQYHSPLPKYLQVNINPFQTLFIYLTHSLRARDIYNSWMKFYSRNIQSVPTNEVWASFNVCTRGRI